jgi:hypothetical protein
MNRRSIGIGLVIIGVLWLPLSLLIGNLNINLAIIFVILTFAGILFVLTRWFRSTKGTAANGQVLSSSSRRVNTLEHNQVLSSGTRRVYTLERNNPQQVEVSWEAFFENVAVRFNGNVVGTITGRKELLGGREFRLPESAAIKVQLFKDKFFLLPTDYFLRILCNGVFLDDIWDPATRLSRAQFSIFIVSGFYLLYSIFLSGSEDFIAPVLGVDVSEFKDVVTSITLVGLIFVVLGFFVRLRSKIALIIAMILYSIGSLFWLISFLFSLTVFDLRIKPRFWFVIGFLIIYTILLFVKMWDGLDAIQALKQETKVQ